jgi:hypothetical protein
MRSILVATVLVIACGSAGADPIKKDKSAVFEKAAKEHCEKFWKAVFDKKIDDALKMMDLPFMGPDRKLEETHDKLKQEFSDRITKSGVEVKVGDAMELKKLNGWLTQKKRPEFAAWKLEAIEKHLGPDSRIVIIDIKRSDDADNEETTFMMVKFKDSKPLIVGVGRSDR